MSRPLEIVDTAAQVVTPENIAFEYRVAGPFLRLAALLLDWLIIGGLMILVRIASVFLVSFAIANAVLLLSVFILMWFYGALFEAYWNGVTPGKAALRLRVISTDGRAVSGLQAFGRNVFRFVDLMPWVPPTVFWGIRAETSGFSGAPLFLVALLSATLTRNYRRVGDLVCGTMVIVEEREWRPQIIHVATPTVVSLARQIPDTFRVSRTLRRAVARYVERRSHLSPERRAEMARWLLEAFRSRYPQFPSVAPDLFLLALYYRIFIADRDRDEAILDQHRVQQGAQVTSLPGAPKVAV